MTMLVERLQDISVVNYIKEIVPDSVKVVDGFPEKPITEKDIPIIAVENRTAEFNRLELGTNVSIVTRGWIIYVYAKNKTQRDHLAYLVGGNLFKNKVPVYDYNQGFPPDVDPDQIGCLEPKRVSIKIPQIDPSQVSMLYRIADIYYSATYKSD